MGRSERIRQRVQAILDEPREGALPSCMLTQARIFEQERTAAEVQARDEEIAALEARIAEVEGERDFARETLLGNLAERDASDRYHAAQTARLARIEKAAGDVANDAETWDCSESWDHEGDCIDNAEPSADDCLRCYVVREIRTALTDGGDDASGEGA